MAIAHSSLGPLDLHTGDWKSYVKRAKLYFTANNIADAAKKRAILLSSCADATYRRIKDVLFPHMPTDVPFKHICTAVSTHLQPELSEIVQRFRFNTRVRQPHKTISIVTQLKHLAQHCNFGDKDRLKEMIRDRLVCGIANEKWQQRLLAEDNLTYDKAYKLLLSLEDLNNPETTDVCKIRPQRASPTHRPEGKKPPLRKLGAQNTATKPLWWRPQPRLM
jgi:hypothetical protein